MIAELHSEAVIVSVLPVPLAVPATTYKSAVPEGISFNQLLAKVPVVIVPEFDPVKATTVSPGFVVILELDLWYAYTMALAVPAAPVPPVAPASAFAIVYVFVTVTSSVLSIPPSKLPSKVQLKVAVPEVADTEATVYAPVFSFIDTSTPLSEATEKDILLSATFPFCKALP